MKKIGKCPVCELGEMLEGTNGFACNYFKDLDNKCSFSIFKKYFGKEITEEIARELIQNKKTKLFTDFINKKGKKFSAKLIIEDGFVRPLFENKTLENLCPVCGGKIEILQSGFGCVNFKNEENKCTFFISNLICNKEITEEIVEDLLTNYCTDFFEDFMTTEGQVFSSRLCFNEQLNIVFDNKIGKCPKCKSGDIFMNKKSFNCSEYKNQKCDFTIWRNIAGRSISVAEAIKLCKEGETDVLEGFRSKKGVSFKAKLVLSDDYKTKFI